MDVALPIDDGTAGQFLQTDGAGVTSWQTVAAGVTCRAVRIRVSKDYRAGALGDSRVTDNGTDIKAQVARERFRQEI